MEPTRPFLKCSYFKAASPAFGAGPVTSQNPLYWFIWPAFSSRVMIASRESIFASILSFKDGLIFMLRSCSPENPLRTTTEPKSRKYKQLFFIILISIYSVSLILKSSGIYYLIIFFDQFKRGFILCEHSI